MNQNLIYIPIIGMESEHDALILQQAIKVSGSEANLLFEFTNSRAVLKSSDPEEMLPDIIQQIRNIGYQVPSIKKIIPVLQMSCASCAVSVESILKYQIGVINDSVNYASAQLSVEYIPSLISPQRMQQAVRSAGYDLLIKEENQNEVLEQLVQSNYAKLKFRVVAALLLCIPLVLISMVFMGKIRYENFIMAALAAPVVFWLGKDFFINAWKQVKHRSANMDTLVAVSTGIAYFFSLFNTLFPEYWRQRGIHAHVYYEASAVVITFILLGKLLEEKAKANTSSAIKKLMGLQPKTVIVILPNGDQIQKNISEVVLGEIVLVKPGEKIAVDGCVLDGSSYVDESMLSGEPMAILKEKNSQVFAGTINQNGSFRFSAQKVGDETMLAQIIRMVRDAQGSKAPVQKLVDKIAAVFVPIVILIAILTFFIWLIFAPSNGFTFGILSMVTTLIIACPCALGLATPTALMVGMGKAASQGILIKDAESLERSKKINAVVLDKTGTITEGKPAIIHEYWQEENTAFKNILVSLEKHSEHPLAQAIIAHCKEAKEILVTGFNAEIGGGVNGMVNDEKYFVGTKKFLEQNNVAFHASFEKYFKAWAGYTIICFGDSRHAISLLALADPIKETSKSAIQQLRALDLEVYLLTGDNTSTAKAIAENCGINHFQAEMLPADKAKFIKNLQLENKVVAMVGDGINDTAAMAQADVSIAMGKGSDIAMDIAGMTIISSDLLKIPLAIKLSKQTVSVIYQNLFWAFIYNLIGIPLAAGILYPINGFLLNPMIAGAAMALNSISVVSNSLRLKWVK